MDSGARTMSMGNELGALALPGAAMTIAARAAGQMILLPWNVFSGMAAGMARLAGLESPGRPAAAPGVGGGRMPAAAPPPAAAMGNASTFPSAGTGAVTTFRKETSQMNDRYKCDDQPGSGWDDCEKEYCKIKLFQYVIVSIRRGDERILSQGKVLVRENMNECDFDNWVIARYVKQRCDKGKPIGSTRFLRVCSQCLCSWDKQPLHYEEKQLDILREIAHSVRKNAQAIGGPETDEVEDEELVEVGA